MSPLSSIEYYASFIELFANMNLNIISRRTATRRITDMYHENCKALKNKLQNVEYVCTKADI